MEATRLAKSVPELRTPAIAAVAGTSLIGASAGSLGGPFQPPSSARSGSLWGVLVVLIAARLIRSPRRATFSNVALYAATFATACLTGVGLQHAHHGRIRRSSAAVLCRLAPAACGRRRGAASTYSTLPWSGCSSLPHWCLTRGSPSEQH